MLATARFLLIEPPRHSQRPIARFIPRFDHGDDGIRASQHQILAHAAMTPRTVLRRFSAATGITSVEALQLARSAKAREALERALTPVDWIAWDMGYCRPGRMPQVVPETHQSTGHRPTPADRDYWETLLKGR